MTVCGGAGRGWLLAARPIIGHPIDFPPYTLYNGDMSDLYLFSILEKDEWGRTDIHSARHYEGAKISHKLFWRRDITKEEK